MNISEKIKQARKNANLTQQELADKTKISRAMLAKYESDQIKHINPETLSAIADATGTTLNWLIAGVDEKIGINPLADLYDQLKSLGITDDDPVLQSCILILDQYRIKTEKEKKFLQLVKNFTD